MVRVIEEGAMRLVAEVNKSAVHWYSPADVNMDILLTAWKYAFRGYMCKI